jgi:hypothetical protein
MSGRLHNCQEPKDSLMKHPQSRGTRALHNKKRNMDQWNHRFGMLDKKIDALIQINVSAGHLLLSTSQRVTSCTATNNSIEQSTTFTNKIKIE